MMFPLRILRFETSPVRRLLTSRWSFVGVLLLLLVVGFSIQNFAVRHSSTDRFDAQRDVVLPPVENELDGPQADPQLEVNQDQDPDQEPGPGDPDSLKEEPEQASDDGLQENVERPLQPFRISSVLSDETCPQLTNIFFLKTHKTGSSTIQNILYRYGENHRLTFALPRNKFHRFFYPMFFQSDFVEGYSSRNTKEFNIMCNHMRFRKSEVSKVMPKNSVYFSILRDPVSMTESMFMHYNKMSTTRQYETLDELLDDKLKNYKKPTVYSGFTHNNLAFDFGYDNTVTAAAPDLEQRAETVIASITRDFDFILISEYFDESMIMLKKFLCWSLEDVVYFKLNTRSPESRTTVSKETAEKIKKWNALDWKIYQHFNETFWYRLRTNVGMGKVKREVAQLKKIQVKLTEACLREGGAVNPNKIKDLGLRPFQGGDSVILGYNLKPDLNEQMEAKCRKLITPELTYTHSLYSQQFPEKDAEK